MTMVSFRPRFSVGRGQFLRRHKVEATSTLSECVHTRGLAWTRIGDSLGSCSSTWCRTAAPLPPCWRESYREGSKVKKRTLANVSKLPAPVVERLRVLL